jgi:hypothetical protein
VARVSATVSDLLAPIDPFPDLWIDRDNFATTADGRSCIRVYLRHKVTRLAVSFEVPIYKTVGYMRVSLFRWKEVEVIDHERISAELLERGQMYARKLMEASG